MTSGKLTSFLSPHSKCGVIRKVRVDYTRKARHKTILKSQRSDIQMVNRYMKRSLIIRQMQIKTTRQITSHLVEWLSPAL